jgi:hypothetical protein
VRVERSAVPKVAARFGIIAAMLFAGIVSADKLAIKPANNPANNNMQQIQLLCGTNWPKQIQEYHACVERNSASADELVKRIEGADENSIEFAIAKSCIERATIRKPAMIDWNKALTCYKNRHSTIVPADEP